MIFPDVLQDLEVNKEMYMRESEGPLKKKAFMALQRALIKCQEIGDEKLCLMTQIIEHIDNRARQLDQDRENLGNLNVIYLLNFLNSSLGLLVTGSDWV